MNVLNQGGDTPVAFSMVLRVEQVAKILAISRSKAYALVATKQIPSVRVEKSTRIPLAGLKAWLDAQNMPGTGGN